jgi:hypothetical protein
MNEGLVFKIGADITQFSASISDVEKELKTLRDTLKTSTGQAIVDTNKRIVDLEQTLVNLRKVGLDKLPTAAANGANALTSLGQVTRDLPFGFIAIQNNLPQVVDSFGALAKQAGGAGPALKSLAASLAGPAGVSFAFGAVIAGVTALIQKYGSLSNAIKVLTADNQSLVKATMLYNDESAKAAGNFAAEEAKVKSLTSSLLSTSTSREKQIAYYNELKKIAPEIVAGIKEENVGTNESNLLIAANTKLRAESVRLKIQEAGITAVASKNAEELAIANKREADAKLQQAAAEKAFKLNVNASIAPGSLQVKTYSDAIANAKAEVKAAQAEIKKLTAVQSQYLNQLDPITLRQAEINNLTRQRIEELKKQGKAEAEALKIAKQEAKAYRYELESIRDIRLSPEQLNVQSNIDKLQELANVVLNVTEKEKKRAEALKQLQAIDPKLFQGLTTQKGSYEALKAAIDVLNEGYILELDYYNRIAKSEPVVDKFALANQGLKEFNQNLFNTIQVYDRETAKLKPIGVTITQTQGKLTPTPEAPIVAPALPIGISDTIDKFAADTNKAKLALDDFKKQANLTAAYNLINDTFFSPLQDLFSNFLSTGKLAIDEFGKAILKAIQQIVAKIIATGIIALLITLFTGGFSAGAGGFAGGIKQVGELVAGSLGFGGKVAAPQFAGIGGGTMGMSGSVNVVLRGSDLVGSINRTNATISRVG